jgi:hypothetical protein
MNRGYRSFLQSSNRGPQEENEIAADLVQTKANEVGQEAANVVDDNKATSVGGKAVEEVRELGEKAADKISVTNMGDKVEESEKKWSYMYYAD